MCCSISLFQCMLIYTATQALETHPDKIASQTIEEVKESAAAKFRDVRGSLFVDDNSKQLRRSTKHSKF